MKWRLFHENHRAAFDCDMLKPMHKRTKRIRWWDGSFLRMCAANMSTTFADYMWGTSDSNECPPNSVRITSAERCKAAATAMGKHWADDPTNTPDRPRGCYWNEAGGNNVFLNKHPVGSGLVARLLLCAVGGALPIRSPHPLWQGQPPCIASATLA